MNPAAKSDTVSKSTAIAFAVLVGLIAAPCVAQDQGRPSASKAVMGAGRFVFGQISEFRRDQYMLDTQTGRLWRVVTQKQKKLDGTTDESDTGFVVLDPVPYLDMDGKFIGPQPRQ